MKKPVIEAEGLSKLYAFGSLKKSAKQSEKFLVGRENFERGPLPGTFWALKDNSFKIESGEIVGIVGRNGAGKSTLLKILSKITEPTSGKAVLRGRIASLLEVGTGFHQELTGRENVFLNGAILGMKKAEIREKLDAIISFSEIEGFVDMPVKHYSSGMYMRLAFSVAAHLDSEILFVDEVLSVGDVNFQRKCLEKIGAIAQTGKTIFFTSHNISAVEALTSRCLLLEKGRLLMDGPSREVADEYLRLSAHHASHDEEKYMIREHLQLKREVEFSKFDFINNRGSWIGENEPIRFRVSMIGNESVDAFRISMTVYQQEGPPVGSFFGVENMSVRKGETAVYEIEIADHRLSAGFYMCAVAVGEGNYRSGEKNFDIVKNVLHFEIVENVTKETVCSRWNPGWGKIKFPSPKIKRVS